MQASRVSNERGMALAVAIFALVVIGALVAGTFFAGRLEQQSGQNTFYASQAAEGGRGRDGPVARRHADCQRHARAADQRRHDRPVHGLAGRERGRHVLGHPPHEQRLAR